MEKMMGNVTTSPQLYVSQTVDTDMGLLLG